jgi:hypothetical protein
VSALTDCDLSMEESGCVQVTLPAYVVVNYFSSMRSECGGHSFTSDRVKEIVIMRDSEVSPHDLGVPEESSSPSVAFSFYRSWHRLFACGQFLTRTDDKTSPISDCA